MRTDIEEAYELISKWSISTQESAEDELRQQLEYIYKQKQFEEAEYDRQSKEQDSYWDDRTEHMWNDIRRAMEIEKVELARIAAERVQMEQRKREEERIRVEEEKAARLEKERKEREVTVERQRLEQEALKKNAMDEEVLRKQKQEREKNERSVKENVEAKEAKPAETQAPQNELSEQPSLSQVGKSPETKILSPAKVGQSLVEKGLRSSVQGRDNKQNQSRDAIEEAEYFRKIIQDIKTEIIYPVQKDKDLKSLCSGARRQMLPKLGQLTNSKAQIRKILGELHGVLSDMQGRSSIAYVWLLNYLAKAIVSQAETETIVSPLSAYPLGTLAAYMMSQHPQLRILLISRFVKKCPYIIGYSCSINTEEGRVRMGYRRVDSRWEDESAHTERMSGITAVWSAITQVAFSEASNVQHPYPISNSWIFVTRTLNLDSKEIRNTHYAVIASWWDLAGERFLKSYGLQGKKLLHCVCKVWTVHGRQSKYPAATRLDLLGDQWNKTGKVGLERPDEN
ncbi:GLE1-like protein-domain-containing protein [Dipodascopsis tothii]|uniref:GLE1-like protein-domain-containing protein n=1 Tax=Dipodascopsis tothii TaxID=44089 RepID=UPI0034CE294F